MVFSSEVIVIYITIALLGIIPIRIQICPIGAYVDSAIYVYGAPDIVTSVPA